MNNFQKKIIKRAIEAINEVALGERERHYMDEYQRNFILEINLKPCDYELSKKQNHLLNKISQKV